MAKQITSAAALMAALAVLVGAVATGGCLPERSQGPYVAARAPAGPTTLPPAMPPEELPPLPPQEQPPAAPSALPIGGEPPEAPPPLPPEEQPAGSLTVPSLSLPAGEQEQAATEILTSGPVHEAFAEPVDLGPQPGLVVPQEPPADIQEVPPDDQPDGADIVWVPGYWAWDADRAGFVWVSGCWRAAPPDTHWVPGYWVQVPDGWQWVSGFWQQEDVGGVVYLAEAPPMQDVEPPGPAPAEASVWVPPCPYWQHNRYVVRRGYWLTLRQGWVWVPSHYVWTPRGYIFIRGHWDYALDRRGVLFAPVYVPRVVYVRPGFVYRPVIVVNLTLLTGDLFVYPRYCHYYFGDYYDDTFLLVGIYPWCDSFRLRKWWDPIFVYDRWRHRRTNPHWERQQREDYDRRRADRRLRPPRTYRQMLHRLTGLSPSERGRHQFARPFSSVVRSDEGPRRFHRVSTVQGRQRIDREASDLRTARHERERRESAGSAPQTGPSRPGPRGQIGLPHGTGRGTPTPTRIVVPTPAPRGPVPPTPSTGERVPPPEGARGRGVPSAGRGEPTGPRGGRGPVVVTPRPRQPEVPSPSGTQATSPPGRGPRVVRQPEQPQPQSRGRRAPALSAEQLRQQQWARDRQEATDRLRQQHEHSAEQARQQQWARDQQEAADRRREQQRAAQRARQQEESRRQQQEQQRRHQPQQDRSRSRDGSSARSSRDSGSEDSGGGRGRRSGR